MIRHARKATFASAALAIAVISLAAGAEPARENVLTLIDSREAGQRLVVHGRVVDPSRRPVPGARLHVYQTDASGSYTRTQAMDEPHARLAGWLTSGSGGEFVLYTIRPGHYPKALHLGDRDRRIPAHIHIDLDAPGYAARKVQAVFEDDPLLSDPFWKEWVARLEQPVLSVSRADGVESTQLTIVLRPAVAPR